MKKTLNTDIVRSELAESVFFRPQQPQPEEERKHLPITPPAEATTEQALNEPVPLVRGVPPVRDVLPVPQKKRIMKQRHPFDIYQDQYEALQALAAEERKNGGIGSMSAMVREALDTFIAKKRKQ
jgi:hypothetical protein